MEWAGADQFGRRVYAGLGVGVRGRVVRISAYVAESIARRDEVDGSGMGTTYV